MASTLRYNNCQAHPLGNILCVRFHEVRDLLRKIRKDRKSKKIKCLNLPDSFSGAKMNHQMITDLNVKDREMYEDLVT